jgi:hypothetical protein
MLPQLIMGGLALGSFAVNAAMSSRAARRQSNLALWNAAQQSQAAWDEAGDTGAAIVRQTGVADRTLKLQGEIADFNAGVAMRRGALEENRTRDQIDRVTGAQEAAFAGAGFDPAYGSPLAAIASSAAQGEMDALIIRSGALNENAGQRFAGLGVAQQRQEAYDSARFGIEGAYRAAGRRASGATATGMISAQTIQKQAMYGVASDLLQTTGKLASYFRKPA